MTDPATLDDHPDDPALAGLAEQITAEIQRGGPVAAEAILARNPAQAGALRAMLPTLGRLAELARAVGPDPSRRHLEDPDPRTTSGL